MKRIYFTDEQRMMILRAAKPKKNAYWTYDTMDLVTGVYEEKGDILLAKIYHLHEGIRRSGDHYSEYKFLVFVGGRACVRECRFHTDTKTYELLQAKEPCPISDDRLLELIEFYFDDYVYLDALSDLAKQQYGLEGMNITEYNRRFLEEHDSEGTI